MGRWQNPKGKTTPVVRETIDRGVAWRRVAPRGVRVPKTHLAARQGGDWGPPRPAPASSTPVRRLRRAAGWSLHPAKR